MFVWLTNTRQRWKVRFEVWVAFYGLFALAAGFFLLFLAYFSGLRALLIWITAGLWTVYGIGRLAQYFLVYHFIRCPQCGANPTRQQKDGCPMHETVTYSRLEKLEVCPKCGYPGDATSFDAKINSTRDDGEGAK
jgi:hypothetical protein